MGGVKTLRKRLGRRGEKGETEPVVKNKTNTTKAKKGSIWLFGT